MSGSGRKHFTPFRSAAEEVSKRSNQESSGLESGHMSSERGRIVRTPGLELPYKAVLTHDAGDDTERAFATRRETEEFIKRNTPSPTPRRTSAKCDEAGH